MEWNVESLCRVSQHAWPELGSTGRGLKGQEGCAAKMRDTDLWFSCRAISVWLGAKRTTDFFDCRTRTVEIAKE